MAGRLEASTGGQVGALFGIIKPGPGRTVVFDLPQLNKIATLDVDTHLFTQYPMPTPASFPVGVRTADGTLSAHFENTIAVTEHGPELLTVPS